MYVNTQHLTKCKGEKCIWYGLAVNDLLQVCKGYSHPNFKTFFAFFILTWQNQDFIKIHSLSVTPNTCIFKSICYLVFVFWWPSSIFHGILQIQACFLFMESLKRARIFPWNRHSHLEDQLLISLLIQGRAAAFSQMCPLFCPHHHTWVAGAVCVQLF